MTTIALPYGLFCKGSTTRICLAIIILWMVSPGCSMQHAIQQRTQQILLNDSTLATGQMGISIADANTGQYLYNYHGNQFFVPSSNVKLFTAYAALKHISDTLPGIAYQEWGDTALVVYPTADPSFMMDEFTSQPVFDFLSQQQKSIYVAPVTKIAPYGKGWSWDDYNDYFMAERNAWPMYGNVLTASIVHHFPASPSVENIQWKVVPHCFSGLIPTAYQATLAAINGDNTTPDTASMNLEKRQFQLKRDLRQNQFYLVKGANKTDSVATLPFITNGIGTTIELLQQLLPQQRISLLPSSLNSNAVALNKAPVKIVYTQPLDSIIRPMLFRSDNFFAEQLLLITANQVLQQMDETRLMDSLLKTDFAAIPQKPRWVDGSGLSRYNLFTPQSMVYVLTKLRNDFGEERLKRLLPTGGQGSLKNYFQNKAGLVFAKTGSMGNHFSLSGLVITKKGRHLLFSILCNHFKGNSNEARRKVVAFVNYLQEKY